MISVKNLLALPFSLSFFKVYTNLGHAEIGSYAATHGVAKAVRRFQENFQGISRQTISDFKRNFNKRKSTDDDVSEILTKKRRRPTLLSEELMTKTVSIYQSFKIKSCSCLLCQYQCCRKRLPFNPKSHY